MSVVLSALVALAGSACSSKKDPAPSHKDAERRERDRDRDEESPPELDDDSKTPDGFSDSSVRCDEAARLVYVVSREGNLHAFSPAVPGMGAYRLIGRLKCRSFGSPQSMAVDRRGVAWVFYDSGELFKVSVRDASCNATSYRHPSFNHQLGMGFTAVGAGLADERLFIASPDFGLATLSLNDFTVHRTNRLPMGAELTGGGDGKLFHFAADTRALSQVDLTTFSLTPVHRFSSLGHVAAWAFSRYAGRFYLFTAEGDGSYSRTTELDPKTGAETVRDPNLGFVVVGAGQSTCVPRNDGDTGIGGPSPNSPLVPDPANP